MKNTIDYNEWSNYTASGYLNYGLEDYNEFAASDSEEAEDCRVLTDKEMRMIKGCMRHAYDRKTLKEAYDYA